MAAETLVDCLAFAVGIGLPAGLVWWLTRGLAHGRIRVATRILLIPAAVLLLGPRLVLAVARPLDEGRWLCLVCGDQEFRSCYAGFVLARKPEGDLPELLDTSRFERWYEIDVGRAHEHERIPVGCHTVGMDTVTCCREDWETYFAVLPRIPAPGRAVAMVECVLRAEIGERRALLDAVNDEEGPFVPIAAGDALDAAAFEARFASWLERHPEWR